MEARPETEAPEPRLFTAAFGLLTAGHFLQALGYSSMILLPLYLDWLDASRSEVGAFMALGAVGGLATRPLVGVALDRWGRRNVLLLGTVVLTAGVAVIAAVTSLGAVLAVSRLMVGVGTGILFTGYFTFAADVVPVSRRTEGLALFGISGLVPLAINPMAGRLGIDPPDLRWFYPGVALLIAASLPFLLLLREPVRPVEVRPVKLRDALRALRARPLWPVWWATLLFGGLVYVFMSFTTVAAEARGVSDPSLMWGTYALGAVSVRALGAKLPDRVGPSRILPPALLSYAAAFALAAVSSGGTGFLVAGLLAGLGHGYCFPVLAGQTFTRSPDGVRGSAMAAFTALWEVAAVCLVPLAGLAADFSSDRDMLLGVAVVAVLSLVAWAGLERRFAHDV